MRIALINMPWARTDAPSIQCGLLQSLCKQAGIECDVFYPNLDLAARLGPDLYDLISNGQDRLNLVGEWLFTYAAFGLVKPERTYLDEYPEVVEMWAKATGQGLDGLSDFRQLVLPEWLAEIADQPYWARYQLVGFSSTFWQNTASIALGRYLRARYADVRLVYGGANFDGDMGREYARHIPWLDFVVTGEGDVALPRLAIALAEGDWDRPIPGVVRHAAVVPDPPEGPRLAQLNQLPTPDYHDYFTTLEKLGNSAVMGDRPVTIPVEFSRGCWWGEKHHCTFCGLNGLGMAYRAKQPDRALSELASLLADYQTGNVEAVDNILDMGYLSTFCTQLAERHWDLNLFFEVKANLSRAQLAILHRAGVRRIQPGIESLSSAVLGLMRKGSTKLINLRLLKWARYYGIGVSWNLLGGFPGESDADYEEQARLIPLLHHLQPPQCAERIWLERFSPFFTDSSLGLSAVRPLACYAHIYPAEIDHTKIAYFFDYEARHVVSDETFAAVHAAISEWKTSWTRRPRPTLLYTRTPGRLTVLDKRTEEPRKIELSGAAAEIYEACGDSARSPARIRTMLAESGREISHEDATDFLNRCCDELIMVHEDGKYLSLALPENPGW